MPKVLILSLKIYRLKKKKHCGFTSVSKGQRKKSAISAKQPLSIHCLIKFARLKVFIPTNHQNGRMNGPQTPGCRHWNEAV